jgi:glycosyltransferase involved in cell wall biosynthesis
LVFQKICFVGADVYPVLKPGFGSAYVGGESVQLSLISKAFLELGYEVSLIDYDYGQDPIENLYGIKVIKTFDQKKGVPIVRFFHPRLSSVIRALENANADVYYQSCAGMMTGVVAWFCKKYGRKFIFRTAHDTDCIPGRQLIRYWRDQKLYAYGLRKADIIAVQGVRQERLLKENYNLTSFPVNMAVEIPDLERNPQKKDIDVLWVNNMRRFKRPELTIELAQMLDPYTFVIIGGPCQGLEEYYRKVMNAANAVKNLNFIGPVPYQKINDYFFRAKLFVNTSESEGFPNSFLQAWIRGVPVVSFFDPDGLIASETLGHKASSLEDMSQAVEKLLRSESRRTAMGARAKEFANNNYSPINVAKHYVRLIHNSLRI